MTAATMTASGITRIPAGRPDRGLSQAADELADRMVGLVSALREPLSLGGGYREAISSLNEVAEGAADADWDGYGAVPVNASALDHAARLIGVLPTNLPVPEVGADPDGEISLEWFRDADWVFSVSVGARGQLSYAGRFGRSRVRGIEEGTDEFPAPLLGHLDRFVAGIRS